MSGNFTTKSLAAGYVSNSALAIIYQTPSGNVGYLKTITITSNTTNPQKISLFKNINGNLYPWNTFTLNQNEWADVLDGTGALTLSAGDSIQANTNSAAVNATSFSVHGVEEK